jgi:hypothetical protein
LLSLLGRSPRGCAPWRRGGTKPARAGAEAGDAAAPARAETRTHQPRRHRRRSPAPPAAAAPAPAGGTTAAPHAAAPLHAASDLARTACHHRHRFRRRDVGRCDGAADCPPARNGETNGSGQVNFPGMLAGVYPASFEGNSVVAFEKK